MRIAKRTRYDQIGDELIQRTIYVKRRPLVRLLLSPLPQVVIIATLAIFFGALTGCNYVTAFFPPWAVNCPGDVEQATTKQSGLFPRLSIVQSWFNFFVASAVATFAAILSGLTQFAQKLRQDTINEVFSRKKIVNDFIVSHEQELSRLVTGATDPNFESDPDKIFDLSDRTYQRALSRIHRASRRAAETASFVEKMFIYYELDNLEFSFTKFRYMLMPDEFMLRSCDIFESRCQSSEFRALALTLLDSTNSYSAEFRDLVSTLAVIGLVKSEADYNIDHESGS